MISAQNVSLMETKEDTVSCPTGSFPQGKAGPYRWSPDSGQQMSLEGPIQELRRKIWGYVVAEWTSL